MASSIEPFLEEGILPKKDTGAISFLTKYPEYDGRGVVIAVLDTGVDPSAAGLQVTTDGKPKVIDLVDCTGSGDVDTSTVVKAENGEIKGLTGRTLKIPSSWNVPDGNFHIGVKYSNELYPKTLRDRMSKEWNDRVWSPQQRAAETEAARTLEEFDKEHPTCTLGEDKLRREELQARIDVLNSIDKRFRYEGSAFDCIVFHDGERWRACMDTSESGELEKSKAMAPYRDFHEYATISETDMMTYSFNIYDNGNRLEVVTNAGAHGTHVASIAAGNFPDRPAVNGIAPGAQVVGLKIGDNRLGSMETGMALVRAMKYVMENKVDVINYSYGEAAHVCNQGRVINLINEAVNEKGVIFVCSAGNNGPALSTVGTPGGTTTSVIAVGAHVTPQMMQVEYSLRENLPPMHYTWSSRGPSHDGALGTCISAPGGAITSVPHWTLKGCQMMNGTSMSSPNACGSLALVLSGLKAEKIHYSPFSIRRALENTANPVDRVEVFALGHGIVQVEEAYKYMIDNKSCKGENVQLTVTCSGGKRGIYLREPSQILKPTEVTINVEPMFEDETDPATKIDFQLNFCLTCTQSWLQIPTNFLLMNASRTFVVKVDPRGLPEGVHYAEVRGFDSSKVARGPMFRVPVTVIVPVRVPDLIPSSSQSSPTSSQCCVSSIGVSFTPGHIHRRFVHVPFGATYAVLKLVSKDVEKSGRYLIHMLQVSPQNCYKKHEFSKFFTISEKGETCHAFPVVGDSTLEVCIAKWWASLGELALDVHITFYGIQLSTTTPFMHGGEGIGRFDILSPLKTEEVSPSVSLSTAVCPLRPSEYKVKCLSAERDLLKDGRQIHAIDLTYNFNLHKSMDVKADCALLSNHLYESEFESQMWVIYDSNKKCIAAGDAYPSQYVTKLDKNNFTILLQVRHENRDKLEKLKDMVLLIHLKLASSISLDVFPSWMDAINGTKKMSAFVAQRGIRYPCFVGQPTDDKFPKGCGPGWYFTGNFSLAKEEPAKSKYTLPFQFFVSENPSKGNKGGNGGKKKEKESSSSSSTSSSSSSSSLGSNSSKDNNDGLFNMEGLEESLRDAKLVWLSKPPTTAGDLVYRDLREKFPSHVPILMARIAALEADKEIPRKEQNLSVYRTAKEAASLVDIDTLLAYYGLKTDNRVDAATIRGDMEQKKGWLMGALIKQGVAQADLILDNHHTVLTDTRDQAINDLNGTFVELGKLIDLSEPTKQTFNFVVKHCQVSEHYGKALKMVFKSWEEKHSKESEDRMLELFDKLGWKHCRNYVVSTSCIRYPSAYRPF